MIDRESGVTSPKALLQLHSFQPRGKKGKIENNVDHPSYSNFLPLTLMLCSLKMIDLGIKVI